MNAYYQKNRRLFSIEKVEYKIVPLDIKEEDKNLNNLEKILNYIDNYGIKRRSETIIAIGGGVLTDILDLLQAYIDEVYLYKSSNYITLYRRCLCWCKNLNKSLF